jgi:hypothetical protein
VCGADLPEFGDAITRTCPGCGKVTRLHKVTMTAVQPTTASLTTRVDRGVNEARIGGVFFMVGASLTVGIAFGFAFGVLVGLLGFLVGAIVTTAILAAVYRVTPVRRAVMETMHRITGQ